MAVKIKKLKNYDPPHAVLSKDVTPFKIRSAMNQFLVSGDFGKLSEYFEMCLTDGHTGGVVQQLESQLILIRKKIEPADDSDEAKIHADFVKEQFKKIEINALIKMVFKSLIFKFGVIQIDWQVKENKYYPVQFERKEDQLFKYDRQSKQIMIKKNKHFTKDTPTTNFNDLISVYYNEKHFPIMYAVLRNVIIKEYGITLWLKFIERFGDPMLIIKYDPAKAFNKNTVDEVELSNYELLQIALDSFGGSGRALVPSDQDIELKESNRNTYDHRLFTKDHCNSEITMAILNQQNTIGGEGHKSRNNLDNMFDVVKATAIYYSDFVFKVISEQLIPSIIQFNFNTKKEFFPRLVVNEPDSEMLKLAVDIGKDIEDSFFDAFGIPIKKSEGTAND